MKKLLMRILLNALLIAAVAIVSALFGWRTLDNLEIVATVLTIAALVLIDYLGDWVTSIYTKRKKA